MSVPAQRAATGSPAPSFTLVDGDGQEITLAGLRGHPVVLAFLADGWDPSRLDQLAHFNRLIAASPESGAHLLGISRDGIWCDLDFADEAVRVPVLSDLDPTGSVAESFGVRGETAVVVIDAEGIVRWRSDGSDLRPDAIAAALRSLPPVSNGSGSSPAYARAGETDSPVRHPSRREFVATTLGAAVALATVSVTARAESIVARAEGATTVTGARAVSLRINGRAVALELEPRVTLLDALREYAGLTATKKGCDHGQCGACTVHVNGRRQLSCLTLAMMHEGDEITTLEGLARGDDLSPMQAAFIEHDGFQCGYCTPGQIMSATALLHEPCGPADADVKECMSGNICRCGAYPGIVAAIQAVRHTTRG